MLIIPYLAKFLFKLFTTGYMWTNMLVYPHYLQDNRKLCTTLLFYVTFSSLEHLKNRSAFVNAQFLSAFYLFQLYHLKNLQHAVLYLN